MPEPIVSEINPVVIPAVKTCKRGHQRDASKRRCPECNHESVKRWQAKNLDKRRQIRRQWNTLHPLSSRAASANARARKCGADGKVTGKNLRDMYDSQLGMCKTCRAGLGSDWHADHIVPLARGGSNWIGNIQALCPACNRGKRSSLPHEVKDYSQIFDKEYGVIELFF